MTAPAPQCQPITASERDQIVARLAELQAKQEAATGWGAAVGAREEEIRSLESRLLRIDAMTAGNQPSSSGNESAFDICEMIVSEEFYLDEENPPSPAIQSYGYAARDRIRAAKREVCGGGAQGAVSCGNLTFGTFVENIAASDRNPIKRGIFIRKTSAKMAEYATKEGCHSTPLDNLRVAPSLTSTTCAGAVTKHSGTFLGYRDERGNEMHCAHAFCPHQAKCHKGCTSPVAISSTDLGSGK